MSGPSVDGIDQFEEIEFRPSVLLNDYFNVTGYIPIDSDWVGAGIWWHEAYYCASQSLAVQIFEVANAERVDPSSTGTDRPEGQVCPNPDCEIDQRWEGFRGLACPECGTKLVVACSRCDSGAVYEDDEETPYCSDHDSRQVATDGGEDRFTDCEECGEPVDMLKAGVWKAPNDEQWWHEGCYDKVEKAEELAERIRNLMVPEGEFDGLSNDFHDQLDAAQGYIETAVERERLKRDQGIGPYDTGTAQGGESGR